MQDDEDTVLRVEVGERSLEEVAIREVAGDVARRRLGLGVGLDLDGSPPTSSGLVEAAVHEEPVEPGVEPVRGPESGQIPPGANEAIWTRTGELRIPQDEAGGRIEAGADAIESTAKAS